MPDIENVKVLVVDDLHEKLLVYRSILEEPGIDLVEARSGPEALRHLLASDFAVILLDVNMPDMDGFETAAMIRSRKRTAHTPIIFVTAYADELHAIKSYSYGAVDYILAPVVPDVLRTKVRVFVELFRLNQQVRAQAARQVAIAERERANLTAVLETAPDFVVRVDVNGRLLYINPTARRLLGFDQHESIDAASFEQQRSWMKQRLHSDSLATARRNGVWFGETVLIAGDGHEMPVSQVVIAHKDDAGNVESFSIIARDISDHRRAEQTKSRLAAIVESSEDAMVSKTLQGIITSWNAGAEQLFGYTAEEAIGQPVTMMIPPDRQAEETFILEKVAAGERVSHFETIRRAKDGRLIDISLTISPMYDSAGRVIGASKVARDITERKRAEAELAEHRTRLEDLVRERTVELEASHKRLRLADRLASIGTLAAGLGHDMGNLLLPVRMRLEALQHLDLPEAARDDLKAITTASEYLKRLSQGLRLFALDPEDAGSDETTNVSHWWADVEPFLRNTLPKGVRLESQIPADLPPVAMAPHTFTQMIYNLVQNAGDVMRGRQAGCVRLSVACNQSEKRVLVSVSDDGPGMSEPVRQRCMEPFFTTKTRGISTGLGLALVRGAVFNAGGSIDIDSTLGIGTTFLLSIPTRPDDVGTDQRTGRCRTACVSLKDPRMSAYVASVLRSLDVQVSIGPWTRAADVELVVTDAVNNGGVSDIEQFIQENERHRAVIFGPMTLANERAHISCLDSKPPPATIREALEEAVKARACALQETSS